MNDWTFESIPDPDVLRFSETKPSVVVLIPADQPFTAVIYKEEEEVGRIDLSTGTLKFEGKADASAEQLFVFLKQLADKYISERLCLKASENS